MNTTLNLSTFLAVYWVSCSAALANDWLQNVQVPPLGTKIVTEFDNTVRTWTNTEVYTKKTSEGLHRWESFGNLPDGSLAGRPWRVFFRDDEFRIVKIVKHPGSADQEGWSYSPHSCDRTLGRCVYSWVGQTPDGETSGQSHRYHWGDDGWLLSNRWEDSNLVIVRSKFNKYGMRTEAVEVMRLRFPDGYEDRPLYGLTLKEIILPTEIE